MTIQFTKMQGAGNDYIYVNTINQPVTNPKELAIQWSTYHTGIGSDGLVLIGPSHIADFSMRIFNADRSEAKMCGKASRCIGKYLYDKKLTQKKQKRQLRKQKRLQHRWKMVSTLRSLTLTAECFM